MRPHLVPVGSNLGPSSDGSGELESTGCAVIVASKCRISRILDGVAKIRLRLDKDGSRV